MPLATGQALAHYEILGPLGSGAMGVVYRARDTRLERDVAIKVLTDELAAGGEALQRFEREARILASLNHPNIAQVYGIDREGDTRFIVMELVPGEDLAERLRHGPLLLGVTIEVGRQMAAGLEAAHEAGVMHRDLKPANVRRTPAGDIKVLDFGLAKPVSPSDGDSRATTLTTGVGTVLGTPTYMAPEQARGEALDRRVDVWAFGCVMYECLTGQRAFPGKTVTDVLAAVLERAPDLTALPPATPPRLRELIERCLRKDPRRRLRDLGDARLVLEELGEGGAPAAKGSRRSRLLPRVLGVGVALLLFAAGAWVARWMSPAVDASRPSPSYRSERITASQSHDRGPSWSPGGDQIAFSRNTTGSNDLHVLNVSTRRSVVLRATRGDEANPRWSPDGRFIATLSTDLPGVPVILVEPTPGGSEQRLIETGIHVFDVLSQWGAMGSRPWAEDGSSLLVARVLDSGQTAVFRVEREPIDARQLTSPPLGESDLYASYSFDYEWIVFARRSSRGVSLLKMRSSGGTPEVLHRSEELIGYPSWHPDGRRLFYLTVVGLFEIDLSTGETRSITSTAPDPTGLGGLSISSRGRIAYSTGWHDTTLIRRYLDSGREERLTDYTGTNFNPRISKNVEIAYHSDHTDDAEIWVLARDGEERRITFTDGRDVGPDWSPDGSRIVFVSSRDGKPAIYVTDGSGNDPRRLFETQPTYDHTPVRWSPGSAGEQRIGYLVAEEGGTSLWAGSPDGTGERRLLENVVDFDWYLDARRVVCTLQEGREQRLAAVHLETGEVQTLWERPHAEIDVAPDGTAVMIATGPGHVGMGRSVLELVPPRYADGLPTAGGEPVDLVRPDGPWHTHHGTWAPDMESIVYVHDVDRATIFELEEDP